jgi:tetratricopeptide (TPR) repeat protein
MIVRLVFLLAFVFVGAGARPAHADDPATRAARRHFERGEKLFALGKFDEALDEYQKAFDAKPIPDFLFNIGQCYRNLGDYDQAIFSFKKYLKLEPEAPNKEAVEALIADLENKKQHAVGKSLVERPRPPPTAQSTPFYKKWWFAVGVTALVVGGGIAIYEGTRTNPPTTDLGNIQFGR